MSAPDSVFPLRAADQCVKCGLCLPHCPTYRLTLDEAESPRGRIALMQGLATGALAGSAALEGHLDGCLTCRACESVCPAEVPYGVLIDSARQLLGQRNPQRNPIARAMGAVMTSTPLKFTVALLLWLYQHLGAQWLVRTTRVLGRGRLARLESLLPRIYLPRLPRARGGGSGPSVALFANCTSPLVEPAALAAAVTLLEALGCRVQVPSAQTCCGALHQHNGLTDPARRCVADNIAAFRRADVVVGTASACTAQLIEYGLVSAGADAGTLAGKVRDIHAFIAAHPAFERLSFRPLPARVLLHTPCTMRNVVKAEPAVTALLLRIPELKVEAMDSGCCGAAGSYFLTQPEMADALLQEKLAQARAARPDFIVSSNVGCAMHFAAGLRRAGLTIPVLPPVRLLARQLADSPARTRA